MRYDFGIKGDGPLYDDEDDFGDISAGSRMLSDEEVNSFSKTNEQKISKGTTVSGQLLGAGLIVLIIIVVAILGATGTI